MNEKNIWHPVKGHDDLFIGHYIVPNFMSTSIAIKVNEKEWIVISPGEALLKEAIEKWGKDIQVTIICPNQYHFMGVDAWRAAFPEAKCYASQKAVTGLTKKGVTHVLALEQNPISLPEGYDILTPPGHRGGDVWVRKQTKDSDVGTVWVICDSFQNYSRLSNQRIARFMQKVFATAPGLKMSRFVKLLLIDDKRGFKTWVLNQIKEDQPKTLIPSHGVVAQADDLPEQLQALIQSRL